MSLRRKDSTGTTSAADVEAPRAAPVAGPGDPVVPSPMTPRRRRTANPILLARVAMRKVSESLAREEEDDNPCGTRGLILLFRELILGLMFGMFLLFASIFLDHINVIHLEGAHNFREAAFDLLNDPETMASFKEGTELKFLVLSEYEAMRSEIEGAAAKLEASARNLARKEAEGKRNEEEIGPVREERERLMNDLDIGVGRFCGECDWQGGISCSKRVHYLKTTYDMGEMAARISVMEMPSCAGDTGKKAVRADTGGHGGGGDDSFCGDCTWKGNILCRERVSYLMDTYGDEETKARASAMERPSCKRG